MNIFILSEDPVDAAVAQLDKHIVKMPLETAQMLCAAYPVGVTRKHIIIIHLRFGQELV